MSISGKLKPVAVNFTPALEDRNRLTVGLRIIWIIPILLFTVILAIAMMVVWFIAFFAAGNDLDRMFILIRSGFREAWDRWRPPTRK